MTAHEACVLIQCLLDEFIDECHVWVDQEGKYKTAGVWELGEEGIEIELWPWKGEFQEYAPHYGMSSRWSGHSWEELVRCVKAYLKQWGPYLNQKEGFMGLKAKRKDPGSEKPRREMAFLGGKLVDPE